MPKYQVLNILRISAPDPKKGVIIECQLESYDSTQAEVLA